MSFGFWTEKDEWDHKNMIRTLVEVAELPDVSVVTFPAYNDTTVALRHIAMKSTPEVPSIRADGDEIGKTFIRTPDKTVRRWHKFLLQREVFRK